MIQLTQHQSCFPDFQFQHQLIPEIHSDNSKFQIKLLISRNLGSLVMGTGSLFPLCHFFILAHMVMFAKFRDTGCSILKLDYQNSTRASADCATETHGIRFSFCPAEIKSDPSAFE
jgi:hypothetical protein